MTLTETKTVASLHILTLSKKAEMNKKINNAIKELKADGTMDKLYADYVTSVLDSGEPAKVEMSIFEVQIL